MKKGGQENKQAQPSHYINCGTAQYKMILKENSKDKTEGQNKKRLFTQLQLLSLENSELTNN